MVENVGNRRVGRPGPPPLKRMSAETGARKKRVVWPWIVGGSIVFSALLGVLIWWLLLPKDSSAGEPDTVNDVPFETTEQSVGTMPERSDVSVFDSVAEHPAVTKRVDKYPQLRLSQGSNTLRGNMIYGEKRFPFTLTFDYDRESGKISNCVYHNVDYKTTIRMTSCSAGGESLDFYGKDGSNDFSIHLFRSGKGRYRGISTSGTQTLDVEMWRE